MIQQEKYLALQFLINGGRSGGPGEDSEQLPVWVKVFHFDTFNQKNKRLCRQKVKSI